MNIFQLILINVNYLMIIFQSMVIKKLRSLNRNSIMFSSVMIGDRCTQVYIPRHLKFGFNERMPLRPSSSFMPCLSKLFSPDASTPATTHLSHTCTDYCRKQDSRSCSQESPPVRTLQTLVGEPNSSRSTGSRLMR